MESSRVNYSPSELIGFRFDEGKFFHSRSIEVNGKEKLLFLEYLIKGKANIYYYRDSQDHYFIETDKVELLELSQEAKFFQGATGVYYELPKRHGAKLKAVLADCPTVYPEIEKVNLNHNSLISLARSYHYEVCDTEDCIVFERVKNKIKIDFIVYLGGGKNRIELGSVLTSDIRASGTFGARMELSNFFVWSERIGVSFDMSFQNFSNYTFSVKDGEIIRFTKDGVDSLYYNAPSFYGPKEELQANLDMTVLKLPVSIFYTFSHKIIRPYIGIGIMNQFVLSQNENFIYKRFADVFGKTVPFYHVGVNACIGSKISINENHTFLLEMNYEYTTNLNVNKSLKLKNNQFAVKIGYQFK